jgi:lipopolysaccharide/colanic/teichoic acid biosynthesis glycosyltransferase
MSVSPTQPVNGLAIGVLEGAEPRPSGAVRRAERTGTQTLATNAMRRGFDLLVATLLVLLAAPLMILVAIAVLLDSRGPVFFRQRRVGRGQREFTMLKFRTMRRDADATRHRRYVQTLIDGADHPEHGHLYKLSVDDRITRAGRVLRSWSLDELPQLLNVIRGDMALVGPRPVIPYEVEMYPEDYLRRFAVKPGLTGLWQVSGRNERTYEEMVSFDIQYAESASLLLDLRILAKTVPVVLRRQGVA